MIRWKLYSRDETRVPFLPSPAKGAVERDAAHQRDLRRGVEAERGVADAAVPGGDGAQHQAGLHGRRPRRAHLDVLLGPHVLHHRLHDDR